MQRFSVYSLALLSYARAAIPDRSLASCQAVAATFDNTCDGGVALDDLASHAGKQVSCTGTTRCPESDGSATYSEDNPCVFTRKLCVTCREDADGTVKVKVQSNALPNHCMNSTVNISQPQEVDWEVVWNADVTNYMNYSESDFDSSSKTDELLCDLQRTASSNMPDFLQYEIVSDDRRMLQGNRPPPNGGGGGGMGPPGGMEPLNTASGVALTGAYIYNSLAGGNVDAVENEGQTLDVCMSHPSPTGQFHYHFWSPCLKKDMGFWSDSESTELCRNADYCTDVTGGFSRNFAKEGQELAYTKANWDDVIGIARDGHVIIGPYDQNGDIWGCNRDVCNGAFIDGQYVYVGSDQFPYVVGCWGPGPAPVYQPTCTSNGCGSIQASSNEIVDGAIQTFASSIGLVTVALAAISF